MERMNRRSIMLKISMVLLIAGAVVGGVGILLGGLNAITLPNIPGLM
ncbi:hypothetical protein [Clostridium sp.]|jgi:hypothetical protein|nr:hypothetical protein [Clostridium sp.]